MSDKKLDGVDRFFATLGIGGRTLETVQIRKGDRWGVFLKFSQKKGFFIGNYIPPAMKKYAEPDKIKKYAKSKNEILFVDRKSYENFIKMAAAEPSNGGQDDPVSIPKFDAGGRVPNNPVFQAKLPSEIKIPDQPPWERIAATQACADCGALDWKILEDREIRTWKCGQCGLEMEIERAPPGEPSL